MFQVVSNHDNGHAAVGQQSQPESKGRKISHKMEAFFKKYFFEGEDSSVPICTSILTTQKLSPYLHMKIFFNDLKPRFQLFTVNVLPRIP